MNKKEKLICQELTILMGYQNFKKERSACTGKWRGTYDYSLVFDNRTRLFISNGMKYFHETVQNYIGCLKIFNTNKNRILDEIREQIYSDNITAKQEGLFPVTVKDVAISTQSEPYCLWAYLTLEVNGITFQFIETGLNYAIKNNKVTEYFAPKRRIYTAGAVIAPTFIIGNVRFSHLDGLYKIKNKQIDNK